jgi:hypothetical protein
MTRLDTPIPVEVTWLDACADELPVTYSDTPGRKFKYVGYFIAYDARYATFCSYVSVDEYDEQSNRFDCLWSMIERVKELRAGKTIFREGETYGTVQERG